MLAFAEKYKDSGKYSQFGEQGIIDEAIRRINPQAKTAVEFGAPTWEYCSNTAHLYDKGWSVRMYDKSPNDPLVDTAEITEDNINSIVNSPEIPTVLSIDCDGPDYRLWSAYKAEPDIVIIEVDSSVPPPKEQFPFQPGQGASYTSMLHLGIIKGYFLLCHTGNMIFILNKHKHLFPEISGDGLSNSELYFNTSHLC